MDNHLVRGTPYFTDTVEKIRQFPYLSEDIECEVLIIGGGIDGIICAYNFVENDVDTVLIDKGRVGFESTSVATALLEYQLDEHAQDLKKYLTTNEIVSAYELGLQSLKILENIIEKMGNECHYSKRPTLIYSQKNLDKNELKKETNFRNQYGFDTQFLDSKNEIFDFDIKAGIFCENGGAEFNPYLFSKQLVEYASEEGLRVYENTQCFDIKYNDKGAVVFTNYGYKITCKKVICSTGYDTKIFNHKPLCKMYTSYSVVTNKLTKFHWHKKTLLHDNVNPYHYIRLTYDNRLIVGGEDIILRKKISDTKASNKYKKLEDYMYQFFPQLKGKAEIEYRFCGAFGTTKNNLGVVGPSYKNDNLWYLLGYGANGIINSLVCAPMLVELYFGKINKNLYLFSPDRKI